MTIRDSRTDIRNRFLAVDTSNVADVLDEFGLPNQGLHPSFRPESGERLAGWAYTIAGEMAAYDGGGDPLKMEACGGIRDEEISVWAGNGEGVCYFGELIALGMVERGSVGALVDGGVRDTRWLREHRFPVFARYHTPVQSIGRWKVTQWQQPVALSGATTASVQVLPGDFVLADEDGALIIPQAHATEVLIRSEELTATETKVRAALRTGKSLAECLAEFGHV
jgi:4-hydroxy-4-methyl-2-oxoglutarate aldolase